MMGYNAPSRRRWRSRERMRAERLAALQSAVHVAGARGDQREADRLGDQWWRLAGRVSEWARFRFVFLTDGAGELYKGRATGWLRGEYARGYGTGPEICGRERMPWRYVSRRRYRELDTSAQTSDGADYFGLMPEDRGHRLRFPTRRHRALNRWRASVGLPTLAYDSRETRRPPYVAPGPRLSPSTAVARVGRSYTFTIVDDPL